MHEVSLIENVIEIVTAEMPKHDVTRVQTITLRIGEMSHALPDALIFGFELLSKGTPLEGAKLIIQGVPTKGRCKTCGRDFIMSSFWKKLEQKGFRGRSPLKDQFDPCPGCGGTDVEIVSGKELEIVEFEGS